MKAFCSLIEVHDLTSKGSIPVMPIPQTKVKRTNSVYSDASLCWSFMQGLLDVKQDAKGHTNTLKERSLRKASNNAMHALHQIES